MVFKRLVIAFFNILFPPIAVCLVAGPGEDLLFNSLLFLLAVIPSHIHGFYISLTYFNRKRRVRKGIYPGKWRRGIFSERVQNGGASNREAERLRKQQNGEVGMLEKVNSRLSRGSTPPSPVSRSGSKRRSQRYSGRQLNEVPSRRSSRRVAY